MPPSTVPTTPATYDAATLRRLNLVNDHVRAENARDALAVVATFGEEPTFWLNGESFRGANAAGAAHAALFEAFPDLEIRPTATFVDAGAVIVESVQRGTHLGPFQGIAATGRSIEVPVCTVFLFDGDELTGERVHLDVASVLGQLGLLAG